MFSEVLFVPQKVTYALKTARHLQETTKQILADLPDAASEFILAIQQDTQPLTRYAYARDLSLFFRYLESDCPILFQARRVLLPFFFSFMKYFLCQKTVAFRSR